MRAKIIQLGHIKTVILISLISIIGSVLVYIPIGYLIEGKVHFTGIVISILAPMIIAPSVSWYMVKLLIKIHHLEIEMRELATFDSLTKVMSRKTFLTNTQTIYELIQRDKLSLAMLYIDIDNFKKINDTYGHSIGDVVLRDFGYILKELKRRSDLVGRLGGEEFAFILPETNMKGATNFADNLRNIVNNKIVKYDNISISYTISIGVSVFNNNNQVNLDELTKQSDEALYIAKHSGKDSTIIYEANKSLGEERGYTAEILSF